MREPDHLIGRTIGGKFLIEARVGSGAMGAVYQARQTSLDKRVAIKVLHVDRAEDPQIAARFRREARAASKLNHPNSVQIIDYGVEEDNLCFIAMEFLDGISLQKLIHREGTIPTARAVDILMQTLAALAVAHDMGVIHRDLKPDNIVVTRALDDDGNSVDVIKVCDFGIAKINEPRSYNDGRQGITGPLTNTGFLIGTPEYMSPEQARGEKIDARSDLYSAGVILYQMMTGGVPFRAENAIGVVLQHMTQPPPPPSTKNPIVNARLEEICMRALEKEPQSRFANAREMRAALKRVVATEPASRAHVRPHVEPYAQPHVPHAQQAQQAPQAQESTPPPRVSPVPARPSRPTPTPVSATGPTALVRISPVPPRASPVPRPSQMPKPIFPVAPAEIEPAADDRTLPDRISATASASSAKATLTGTESQVVHFPRRRRPIAGWLITLVLGAGAVFAVDTALGGRLGLLGHVKQLARDLPFIAKNDSSSAGTNAHVAPLPNGSAASANVTAAPARTQKRAAQKDAAGGDATATATSEEEKTEATSEESNSPAAGTNAAFPNDREGSDATPSSEPSTPSTDATNAWNAGTGPGTATSASPTAAKLPEWKARKGWVEAGAVRTHGVRGTPLRSILPTSSFSSCYATALLASTSEGERTLRTGTLSLQFDNGGGIRKVALTGVDSPGLAGCVESAAATVRLGRGSVDPDGGTAEVNLTFHPP